MRTMTKINILNVGFKNKGNYALVKSTMDTIAKHIPDAEFTLYGSENLYHDNWVIRPSLASRPDKSVKPWIYLSLCVIHNLLGRIGINFKLIDKTRLTEYNNADVIINSGGDQTSGDQGFGVSVFLNLTYGILLNKPIVLYGESLGYFKNTILNWCATQVFQRIGLIILREDLSLEYLKKNNISRPKVFVTADPAFNLQPATSNVIEEVLIKENINIGPSNKLIGINPSELMSQMTNSDNYLTTTVKLINKITAKPGVNVLLIPHVFSENVDDRECIRRIINQTPSKSQVFAIDNEYSPQILKGIIGRCDIFIGGRMHATIASTSMLVPTIGVAYSHKMHGIIGQMLGMDKYILDLEDYSYENLLRLLDEIETNAHEIKKELREKIPHVQKKADSNGKLVKQYLQNYKGKSTK